MEAILNILQEEGPLTGRELMLKAGGDEFTLWAACSRTAQLTTRIIGRRYLRLDRTVEEYARLSPSIMREFLGYTVIGLASHRIEIERKAGALEEEIAAISLRKLELTQKTVARLVEALPEAAMIKERACFLIAGDVAYRMAHAEPRPECSTGELVKGSDLDLIVVTAGLPEALFKDLDAAIHKEKYKLLTNPASREELDYIVKDTQRVREQLQMKDFKSMVAAKILREGEFLYGSRILFDSIKEMLVQEKVPRKLAALEEKAIANRAAAEAYLLAKAGQALTEEESMKLFYTAEEKEEIF